MKHLPAKVLGVLFIHSFNNILKRGQIAASWKEATVFPIPKPGKDHKNPTNYRPIALTSRLCKTMERMDNARLVWLLESEHLIPDFQSGFRRGRNTWPLESFVRETFIKKEHAVAVCFDLEKAYDTTWKHGIMKDLHAMGFRGRLPWAHMVTNETNRNLFVHIKEVGALKAICGKEKRQFLPHKCHFNEKSKMAAVSMETKKNFWQHGFHESRPPQDSKTVFRSLFSPKKTPNDITALTKTSRMPGKSSLLLGENKAAFCREGPIFSDSKSCLEALKSLRTDHPVLLKIMTKLRILENTGHNIQFDTWPRWYNRQWNCWPSS